MPRVISEFEGYRIVRGPSDKIVPAKGEYMLKMEQFNGRDALGHALWMPEGTYDNDIKRAGKDGGHERARLCRWVSSLIPITAEDDAPWPP